jgi:hypothetical protein
MARGVQGRIDLQMLAFGLSADWTDLGGLRVIGEMYRMLSDRG